MKMLFVNCCMRKGLRTEKLCRSCLEKINAKDTELQEELCSLFSITGTRFYAAEGMDIFPEKQGLLLSEALEKCI